MNPPNLTIDFTAPTFDGATFDPQRDTSRLARQMSIVRGIMADGQEHTLDELAKAAECSVASASARVRDLRKRKHGSNTVERRWIGGGVFVYRMVRA